MSYDVRLEIDTGGENPADLTEWRDPTYNLGPMFSLALGAPFRSFDGKIAGEFIPFLRSAIAAMEDSPAKFKELNPKNGWGDYDGALTFFREFLVDCLKHPKATVRI